MLREVVLSNRFIKDFKLMKKRGKSNSKIYHIINLLEKGGDLPMKYRDHKLIGSYEGSRDLHIEPDWILIYRFENDKIIFERTGTHSDLFK